MSKINLKWAAAQWLKDWEKTNDQRSKDAYTSLKLEIDTGKAHCACCLKPVENCPRQSRNGQS
jgi:hypothetical protein